MKTIKILVVVVALFLSACNDYLDIVPDNIATIDHAFKTRAQAEGFLFTCYSSLPNHADPFSNPAFLAGDEMVIYDQKANNYYPNISATRIGRGEQYAIDPYLNFWDGQQSGKNLFIGIRDCNIFLENIHKTKDLDEFERRRWVSEVKFLKAYYHFYLMRLYGPVPIIDENLPINSTPEQVRIYREPVSEVVNYISDLIDEAVIDLPSKIYLGGEEDGRITKSIALAIKAQARVLDASPFFNGNSQYSDFVDNRGTHLISQTFDQQKWDTAYDAVIEAINEAHGAGHALYYFDLPYALTDSSKVKMSLRGAVTEPWNPEIIWGATTGTYNLQRWSQARFTNLLFGGNTVGSSHAPGLRMVELFYTNKGIPVAEDPTYTPKSDWYSLRTATDADRYYIVNGYKTVNIHFNREPRFYSSLAFDGGTWLGNGRMDDNDPWHTNFKKGGGAGLMSNENVNATGYLPKKLVSHKTVVTENSLSIWNYSFPIVRLADLYLLAAEAANEAFGPGEQAYQFLDQVRVRAGLKGVSESWASSTVPNKPNTKEGLREIIHTERLIELAFEGSRFYDLIRWKKASEYINQPIRGWNIFGETPEDFYQEGIFQTRLYTRRDNLWPIKETNLYINKNLVQNPGWN
ncbi:RagB/SusD family nutrient uptake outer membrane protein [Mariniphaga sediminis]|uniref:RagB/SusD family nutrient uptake outer membrane protein n=1 Tax=Mariniphaga sediminis TaxID=1628158 RepID=UPI003563FCB4